MARSSIVGSIVLFIVAGLSESAMADDLAPPPWRFTPGTTVQHWDFSSGPTGFSPDALPLNNAFGSPLMSPSIGTSWRPAAFGRLNVWEVPVFGSLGFEVPNTGVQTHMKNLWLQVTFFGTSPILPGYAIASPSGSFTLVGAPVTTALPGGWLHQLTQWSTPICPNTERVTISPGFAGSQLFLDQVVIDTQCIVPTPGTASLLFLGGLCSFRRRRPAAV